MHYKVVIVDSDSEKIEYSAAYFIKDKFKLSFIDPVNDYLKFISDENPDIIVLKLLYNCGKEGVEICNQIRTILNLKLPLILFISAYSENYAKVAALNAGADLFFSTPLSKSYFIAQLNSYLNRFLLSTEPKLTKEDSIKIDFEKYLVKVNGQELVLPKKEFEILTLLMSQQRKVFSRVEIKKQVWLKPPELVRNRTIDVHIRKLREKLGNKYIQTVKGVGYKFEVVE